MRSVFGYFQTIKQAQRAVDQLKAAGFQVSIDRFAPAFGEKPDDLDNEIHGIFHHEGNSLTTTTLESPISFNEDQKILASAHVDASGLSGGNGFDHPEDICVTVLTDDENYQEAEKIMQENGAK